MSGTDSLQFAVNDPNFGKGIAPLLPHQKPVQEIYVRSAAPGGRAEVSPATITEHATNVASSYTAPAEPAVMHSEAVPPPAATTPEVYVDKVVEASRPTKLKIRAEGLSVGMLVRQFQRSADGVRFLYDKNAVEPDFKVGARIEIETADAEGAVALTYVWGGPWLYGFRWQEVVFHSLPDEPVKRQLDLG